MRTFNTKVVLCEGIQDSLGFKIPPVDCGSQILDSGYFLSVELGFWIPIVSGIPESLSCTPHSKAQDSGFSYMGRRIIRVIILDWRLPDIKECSDFSIVY